MQVREACMEDADEACRVVRRSITELCHADHKGDAPTLALWLANKTAENMRRWIDQNHVFVAIEGDVVVGVGSIRGSGEIMLNYVSPDFRFRGVSKALVGQLEARASDLAVETITLLSSGTARQFYLAVGYKENGPPIRGYGKTLGHSMAKQLT
jgi:GNAT superfamily N-acetyltransferase